MKKDWSQARWIALLPLLAVVLLYMVEIPMRNYFFVCNGPFCDATQQSIPNHIWDVIQADGEAARTTTTPAGTAALDPSASKMTALRFEGRISWSLLVKIYLFICVAAFAVAGILTYQRFPQRAWLWLAGMLLASAGIGRLLYANPGAHMLVFQALFQRSIHQDLPAIANVTNFLNSLGNAATFALLLTICALLLPTPLEPYPAGLKQLSQKMKSLRTILYVGTLLLVVTMLLKESIFQWALAYTSQEPDALEVARTFVASLLTMDGTFYTLMLAAAYLPARTVIQRRARFLENLPADEAEVEKKLQDQGLVFSSIKSIPRVIAIFAPFLAGPLGELINNILF